MLRLRTTGLSTAALALTVGLTGCPDNQTPSDGGEGEGEGEGGEGEGEGEEPIDPNCDTTIATGDCDRDGVPNGVETTPREIVVDINGYGIDAAVILLERRQVTSNPLKVDSDDDGVDDGEEFTRRTDPSRADTDGDNLSDFDEINRWATSPVSVDTDGDARTEDAAPNSFLFDGEELALVDEDGTLVPGPLATSPTLADTDGDGVSDSDEQDNPSRSPVIAEMPALVVELVDDIDLRLNVTYSDSEGQSTEFGTSLSSESSSELSKADGTSTAVSAGLSTTVGLAIEASFPPSVTASVEVTASVGVEHTITTETTTTTAQSIANERSQLEATSRDRTVSTESGEMSTSVRLRNRGTEPFGVSGLAYSVRQLLPDGTTRALTTLRPAGNDAVDSFVLAANSQSGVIPLDARDLNVDLVRSFLENPSSLIIEPIGFELTNADGTPYTFTTQRTFDQTALVIVDNGRDEPRRLRIATIVNRLEGQGGVFPGIALGHALTNASVDFETEENADGLEVLAAVDDLSYVVAANDGPALNDPPYPEGLAPGRRRVTSFWAVFADLKNGGTELTRDFSKITIQGATRQPNSTVVLPGDEVRLVFVRDSDQDGVSDREEYLRGSLDSTPHTDGDGLSDWYEIKVGWDVEATVSDRTLSYHVYSSPGLDDSDGDGLDDREEFEAGTDPRKQDTDEDGLLDSNDPDPLVFQNTAPTIANFSVSLNNADATVTATVTDFEDNLSIVRIDWGDGTIEEATIGAGGAINETHTYTSTASFSITVTAEDDNGAATTQTSNQNVVLFPAPIVRLKLDGNFDNSGSRTVQVTNHRITEFETDRTNLGNSAANLFNDGESGQSGYITTPNLNLGTNYSFSIWVKLNNNNQTRIMGQSSAFTLHADGGRVRFSRFDGFEGDGNFDNIIDQNDDPQSGVLATNQWHHLIGVVENRNGTTFTRLYVNGVRVGEENHGALLTAPTNCRLHIGTNAAGNDGGFCQATNTNEVNNNFPGFVDDVRVHTIALNDSQAASLFAAAPNSSN